MKVVVLYRPNSEFARGVDEFLYDLRRVHGIDDQHLQVLDYDSRDGMDKAATYGILTQPAVLVVNDDGGYVKHWEGGRLPLQEEVAGYLYSSLGSA